MLWLWLLLLSLLCVCFMYTHTRPHTCEKGKTASSFKKREQKSEHYGFSYEWNLISLKQRARLSIPTRVSGILINCDLYAAYEVGGGVV